MNVMLMAVPMATKVNLKGGWDSVWGAVKAGFPGIGTLLTVVGVILVLGALLKFVWERRRGGGMAQGAQPLWGALIPGAVLCAPALLIPMFLGILDWIINIAIKLANAAGATS